MVSQFCDYAEAMKLHFRWVNFIAYQKDVLKNKKNCSDWA